MEHRAGERFNEKSLMEMTIKTEVEEIYPSNEYIEIEIDLNHLKEEPGLEQLVKEEPLLVKEEILDKSGLGASTSAGTSSVNESYGHSLNTKHEPGEMDIGPTVLQHMDSRYTIDQNTGGATDNTIVDHCNKVTLNNKLKKDRVQDKLKEPEDSNYHCDKCIKTFQSKRVYMNHCKYMHGTESYKCTECNKEFKWMPYLRNHINNMHSKMQYECDVCKKIFKSKQTVSRHISRIHGHKFPAVTDMVYSCEQCPKTYPSNKSLKRHYKLLHSKSPHKCTECNKEFQCKNYLISHVRRVHFECDVCKKMCKSRQALSDHVLKYHRNEPTASISSHSTKYVCYLCQKSFWTKRGIREHIDSVHGARIHRCLKCNKNYKNLRYLQYHNNVIHGEVKYGCELCRRLFKTKQNLNDHCKRMHSSKDG